MNTEIKIKLEEIAFKKTVPFCYSCYKEAPTGCCSKCHSDDLMRLRQGSGCEYGIDWVIEELITEALTPVNTSEAFEQSMNDCYPETTTVGWMQLDTVSVMKEMDPVCWDMAKSEWESAEVEEGNIISFDGGSTYFWKSDVESFIEEQEA